MSEAAALGFAAGVVFALGVMGLVIWLLAPATPARPTYDPLA